MSEASVCWKADLKKLKPHYFGGIVSNSEELLERHKVATQSCFGTRSSTKKKTSHNPGEPAKKVSSS